MGFWLRWEHVITFPVHMQRHRFWLPPHSLLCKLSGRNQHSATGMPTLQGKAVAAFSQRSPGPHALWGTLPAHICAKHLNMQGHLCTMPSHLHALLPCTQAQGPPSTQQRLHFVQLATQAYSLFHSFFHLVQSIFPNHHLLHSDLLYVCSANHDSKSVFNSGIGVLCINILFLIYLVCHNKSITKL